MARSLTLNQSATSRIPYTTTRMLSMLNENKLIMIMVACVFFFFSYAIARYNNTSKRMQDQIDNLEEGMRRVNHRNSNTEDQLQQTRIAVDNIHNRPDRGTVTYNVERNNKGEILGLTCAPTCDFREIITTVNKVSAVVNLKK